MVFSQERMGFFAHWPEPVGGEQPVAVNVFKGGKPKDFLGLLGDGAPNGFQAAYRWHNHENAETLLSK
jgi:hypothetical protein